MSGRSRSSICVGPGSWPTSSIQLDGAYALEGRRERFQEMYEPLGRSEGIRLMNELAHYIQEAGIATRV